MIKKITLVKWSLDCDPDPGFGDHISLETLMHCFEHQRKINPDSDIRVAVSSTKEIELYYLQGE